MKGKEGDGDLHRAGFPGEASLCLQQWLGFPAAPFLHGVSVRTRQPLLQPLFRATAAFADPLLLGCTLLLGNPAALSSCLRVILSLPQPGGFNGKSP